MKLIKLNEEYSNSLELSFTAENIFQQLQNKEDKEFVLDFQGIEFLSLSFTQEYVYQKKHSNIKITEINLNKEIKPMLDLVEKRYDK